MSPTTTTRESHRIEFKRQLSGSLEKEVVAFLNSRDGGLIYIGVDDKTQKPVALDNLDALQQLVR